MNTIENNPSITESKEALVFEKAKLNKVTLKNGVTLGNTLYTEVFFRELKAKDLFEAQDAAEKVVTTKEGLALIISPVKMGLEILRRQIASLASFEVENSPYNGPLSMEELGRFSLVDLELLQRTANTLDFIDSLKVSENMETRGRDEGGNK